MENKINALFYNYSNQDIKQLTEAVQKLGYFLNCNNIKDLNTEMLSLKNRYWDVVIFDYELVRNKLDSLVKQLFDWNPQLSILIASDRLSENLIQDINKIGINDIVVKSNISQVCLGLIRNFKKTKVIEQFDFTKKELLRSQKTQSEHDHFLNQLIESTSNPIFYKGKEGRYFGCNKAFAEFIGLPKEEIIGKTVFDVAPEKLAKKYHEMDEAFFKNPVTQKYEHKVANVKGDVMDVIFYKTALRDDGGNILGLLGHMFDVTEQRKFEAEKIKEKEIADFILDTSDRMYITLDLNGNITSINKKACKILELNKDQLLGANWFDKFIPENEIIQVKNTFNGIIDGSVIIDKKIKGNILTATKKQKVILWESKQIRDSGGNIIGALSSGQELKQEDKLVQELEMSERKYKALVENMHEGLSIIDFDETVIFSNASFDHIFGYNEGEMLGKNLKDFIVPEDIPKILQETKNRKNNISSQYKVGIKRKDGKKRIIEVFSVPWMNDKEEIVGTLGLIIDKTAEEYSTKRLEKKLIIEQSIINISSQFISTDDFESKLEDSLKELHNIIEAERYSILTINNNKLNLVLNKNYNNPLKESPKFEEMDYNLFGYSLNMLDSLDFIFIEDVSKLPEEAKVEKEVFEKYNIFNFLGIPFYSNLKLKGLLVISNIYEVDEWTIEDLSLLRTISDIIGHAFSRKEAEDKVNKLNTELITKNKELEQVVYVTSHDIRSPVVNILGFSDEMIKALDKLSDKIFNENNKLENQEDIKFLLEKDIPHILNFIKISGQKIDKLLLALLKLSRLGRAAINKVKVDMNRLVSSLISTFEYKIHEENINIEVDDLPTCYTDEVQINQVFSNLIDNAIKYRSTNREARIKITGKEESDRVIYCVEDNGIGISETELDKIFDVFYRINPDNQNGEGMGLSLIKKTIERLDGKISVGSEEGAGSRFFINLEKPIV